MFKIIAFVVKINGLFHTILVFSIILFSTPTLAQSYSEFNVVHDSHSNFLKNTKPKPQEKNKTYTLTGQLTLIDSKIEHEDNSCRGKGGYGDLSFTTRITIYDGKQNIIAMGQAIGKNNRNHENWRVQCIFNLTVENIPKVDFYIIEIGRRKIQYSFQELEDMKWNLDLSLYSDYNF
ncbi:hypothetical protein [Geminocystis herdmanii]|uniref:hypothetical protein n=1 Tax=Geminocystis herdmanii TaxID=669359 RepID=UPI0003485DD4|nr:hypothetical protein [Geminocystis herdmanii]